MLGLKKTSILLYLFISFSACAQNNANSKLNKINMTNIETITLGSGCFWCTEAFFQRLKGVVSVTSGYSGGFVDNPTYEQVCDKTTGHAEVCQVLFDTTKISLDEILSVFWKTHDPTTLNRQGNDVGTQYRSAVFFHNENQKSIAIELKNKLNNSGAFNQPIITEISEFKNFYPAEDYHQNYYNLNGEEPYCQFLIKPKLDKFKKVFSEKLK